MSYSKFVYPEIQTLMFIQAHYEYRYKKLKFMNVRIKQLIFTELLEIAELWSDIPLAQHLYTIMRPHKDAYGWSDELLLKKIEKYREELEVDEDE